MGIGADGSGGVDKQSPPSSSKATSPGVTVANVGWKPYAARAALSLTALDAPENAISSLAFRHRAIILNNPRDLILKLSFPTLQ
jgi:hypothetical protein